MNFEISKRTVAILRLHLTPGIGPQTIKELVRLCPNNIEDIFQPDLLNKLQVRPKLKQAILNPKIIDLVEQEIEIVEHQNVQILDFLSEDYPQLLQQIYDPPPVLYVRGNLQEACFPVAVVGTRRPSYYGKQLVQNVLQQIRQRMSAVVIISGLAYGIDTLAHRQAVQLGLPTIAVLGSGLGMIYPATNHNLVTEILEHGGAVISEYAWNTSPAPQNFPNRNRIISGLSKIVWIPEAGIKSGALITARAALEQNRDIFASPGNVDSVHSAGCHWLIQQNQAKLLLHGSELLENANLPLLAEQPQPDLPDNTAPTDPLEIKILDLLEGGALNADILAESLQTPVSELLSKLTMMELNGLIKTIANGDLTKIHKFSA